MVKLYLPYYNADTDRDPKVKHQRDTDKHESAYLRYTFFIIGLFSIGPKIGECSATMNTLPCFRDRAKKSYALIFSFQLLQVKFNFLL